MVYQSKSVGGARIQDLCRVMIWGVFWLIEGMCAWCISQNQWVEPGFKTRVSAQFAHILIGLLRQCMGKSDSPDSIIPRVW
jgi:hypothetical protein